MLIFHEGLPGSGKTYEAVAKHLIPALKKGRHVYARIDGLNLDQLATLAGISVDFCRSLCHHVDVEHIKTLEQYDIPVGSLVVIDELQNYFPDSRQKLSDGITQFVAEHRHKGLDIVFMGQDLKDCHKIWRRRVDAKILFSKLDMLGSKKYRWRMFKAIAPEKFREVSSGEVQYDPAIFGSYKSFEAGAEVAQSYDDKRQSIWHSRMFRRVIPLVVIGGLFAIWYVFDLFKGGGLEKSLAGKTGKTHVAAKVGAPAGAPASPGAAPAAAVSQVAKEVERKGERDFVMDLSERYRLRLSGVAKNADRLWVLFEWYDEAFHVKERLTLEAVRSFGYVVSVDDRLETASISKGKMVYVATQFPLASDSRVSDDRVRQIAGLPGSRSRSVDRDDHDRDRFGTGLTW